jgi:hypothetical protein
MSTIKASVSVDEQYLDKLPNVVKRVKKVGFHVEQTLASIGVITGTVDSEKIDSVRKVKGVASVEQEKQFQLPPPSSPTQ